MPITVRAWTCPGGHTHHDRDIHAAINFAHRGRPFVPAWGEFGEDLLTRVCLTADPRGDELGERSPGDDRS
jgi:transposase